MKKTIPILIILLMFSLSSCFDNFNNPEYSEYKPVLMKRDVLEQSISFQGPRQLCRTGKMYFKDNFIYINEKYEGVHVIDNSNPAIPVSLGFIVIPGSVDMAMKNNILYVDNAVDLVSLDLSGDLDNIQLTKRIREIFPEDTPPDGLTMRPEFQKGSRPENTIIIGWEKI